MRLCGSGRHRLTRDGAGGQPCSVAEVILSSRTNEPMLKTGWVQPFVSLLPLVLAGTWQTASPSQVQPTAPEVVVVPTLGTDHQFALDYSVAHVAAVLDAIAPDALAIADVTDWLRAGCVYRAVLPENHIALKYAREKPIPIWGTRTPPPPSEYEHTVEAIHRENERYATPDAVEREYRVRLDETTARIAREFSFTPDSQTLRSLLRSGFPARAATWTPSEREAIAAANGRIIESLVSLIRANPQRRWAVLLPWGNAVGMAELLRAQSGVRYRPVDEFLTSADSALAKRMDTGNISWILSGMLDDWYGMWAPQIFPAQRIAALLRQLQTLAPRDPSTRFLEARWLMRNRDFRAAESVLMDLVAGAGEARFPFPINGKWIRPPWSSVQKKAKLNLAFVHDLRGDRDGALRLYRELLAAPDLDAEARAAGYAYDDIRWVIEDYTRRPFTGRPEEAFRHYRGKAAMPPCATRQ